MTEQTGYTAAKAASRSAYEGDTVWEERDPFIDRIPRWVAMTGLFVLIIGIWYTVTALEIVSNIILPGPGETWRDIVFVGNNMLDGGYMLEALITTTKTVLYAFLLAMAIGFSLGVLVGEPRTVLGRFVST
jgi:NitT/TauT family transport system permease protein